MSNAADRLCATVLAEAERPLRKQVQLLRDCAEILAGERDASRILEMAAKLERDATDCRQLVLDFQRRAEA